MSSIEQRDETSIDKSGSQKSYGVRWQGTLGPSKGIQDAVEETWKELGREALKDAADEFGIDLGLDDEPVMVP
jgi:hypothetical protein